jgi:phosphate transport system permease protein
MNRKNQELVYFTILRGCVWLVVAVLAIILLFLLVNGLGKISWSFLTENPRANSSGALVDGGILSPIMGTIYLMLLVFGVSIPIGVLGSVFLVEILGRKYHKVSRIWWIVVNNLAGVPSIVYGLLGVALFVTMLQFGLSLIAAGMTLALMVLPIIMVATREALEAVPNSLREASIALGATKWQTIRHHIMPYSASGILTGTILSLSRAGGETAPILVTGATMTALIPGALNEPFQAIPYYIYQMGVNTADIDKAYPNAYGAALVLLAIVVLMNFVAIYLRNRYRKKYRW